MSATGIASLPSNLNGEEGENHYRERVFNQNCPCVETLRGRSELPLRNM